jgi:hypothetical protein
VWSSVKYEYFIVKWNADNDSPILRRLYQQQGGFDRNKYALLHDQVDIEREGRSGSFALDGAVHFSMCRLVISERSNRPKKFIFRSAFLAIERPRANTWNKEAFACYLNQLKVIYAINIMCE